MGMKKLTEQELLVMDTFKITPNALNLEEWRDGGHYPSDEELIQLLDKSRSDGLKTTKEEASSILSSLEEKLRDYETGDSITIIEMGTWVMDHYFTKEQLEQMSYADGIKFLQDWKYWFGYRKQGEACAYMCIRRAILVKEGALHLDPDDDDIWYLGDNTDDNLLYGKYYKEFNAIYRETHKQ